MRRWIVALAGSLVMIVWLSEPAAADGEVTPGQDGFVATLTEHFPGTGSASSGETSVLAAPVVDLGTGILEAFCSGINWSEGCSPTEESAEPIAVVTPGLVESAFRRLTLPAAQLVVQPPNGRTLVNFETNFYTEQGEFTRTVRLLGRQVELRIWPERFGWQFGDGHERWTTSPGDKYPNLEITHRYLSKGRVAPSVATTYAAEFRVGNGPWRDVTGTVTIPGASQTLRVVTARPVLVGGS